jgi:hypothetical protein
MYTDADAWRVKVFKNWPDQEFIKKFLLRLNNRMFYVQVNDFNRNGYFYITDLIQGGFFAGNSNAITTIYEHFYRIHDASMDFGYFIGKDQNMMNRLTFKLSTKNILRLRAFNLNFFNYYDVWLFYQYYFAHIDEYFCN